MKKNLKQKKIIKIIIVLFLLFTCKESYSAPNKKVFGESSLIRQYSLYSNAVIPKYVRYFLNKPKISLVEYYEKTYNYFFKINYYSLNDKYSIYELVTKNTNLIDAIYLIDKNTNIIEGELLFEELLINEGFLSKPEEIINTIIAQNKNSNYLPSSNYDNYIKPISYEKKFDNYIERFIIIESNQNTKIPEAYPVLFLQSFYPEDLESILKPKIDAIYLQHMKYEEYLMK
jgi:hypothetical protein